MSQKSPEQRRKIRRRRLGVSLLLTLGFVAGCQASYYGQAVNGHTEIWWKQRPTKVVLKDPKTDDELRSKLELVQELLAFAEAELHLPNDGNYTSYADLEREYVVWSVFAAPELEVDPVSWTYPVLGDLDYRGYYKEAAANKFGDKLKEQGLDVAVVGVPAYSTLGWFRDPLLNTFIDYDEDDLAGLIFHELSHKKYYRHGDTEFSEAFAVAVENEGVRRWLKSKGDTEALAKYEKGIRKVDDFVQMLLDARAELDAIYTSERADDAKRAEKAVVLSRLQNNVRSTLRAAGREPEDTFWLRDEINNAHLNIIATYYLRVPEFEQVLKDCGGDIEAFYKKAEEMP